VVTLAIWGAVTPAAILTKCRMWGDMVDVITCAVFGDCRLRGVGVLRGVNLPSSIDLTRVALTTLVTLPCDRVITGSAVALHCVKAHRQSQWRSPNFNPL